MADIEAGAIALASAFKNDPVTVYIVPDENERNEFLPYFFQSMLIYGIRYGEAYATSENFEGVIIWLPGSAASMSIWKLFRSKAYSLIFKKASGVVKDRMLHYYDFVKDLHRQHADFPHRFLLFVGVQTEYQGKGYAGRLITPMLNRSDAEQLPIFLETQNEKNVGLYEHYGFRVVEKTKIPKTGLTYWAMLRSNTSTVK